MILKRTDFVMTKEIDLSTWLEWEIFNRGSIEAFWEVQSVLFEHQIWNIEDLRQNGQAADKIINIVNQSGIENVNFQYLQSV